MRTSEQVRRTALMVANELSNDINQCGVTSCHTCNIFINDQSFKSNLAGKEYNTISYDTLSWVSTNVIYGIHCVHCVLVYEGETGRSLRSRMNGHRSAIKKGGQSLLHRHFHQPDHSVDDMRVQIFEKIYHRSENPGKSPQFTEQENCSGSRSLVQPNHMASMTKSKESVP